MFIKKCISKSNGKTYTHYQIANSYRQDGKVKHKIIASLSNLTEKDIDNLITGLNRIKQKPLTLIEAKLQCKKVLHFGEIQILDFIWQKLGISEIIRSLFSELDNVRFDITPYIKLMTFCRFLNQGSELKLTNWFMHTYFPEISILEYHKLLRSLGYIMRIKDGIEKKLFLRQKDIFHLDVDLVFYDITSTYFEGDGPELAGKGYSRDKRPDRNQVVIALAITKEGFPIGHEVLEGNTLDKDTVKDVIDKLRVKFSINTCIFVGDRGMITRENIEYIEEQGYRYIFALRRRRLHEAEDVLEPDLSKYSDFIETDIDGKRKQLKTLEIINDDARYILCHNPDRAVSDLDRLEKKLTKLNDNIDEIVKNKKKKADRFLKQFSRLFDANRFYDYGIDEKGIFYYRFKDDSYEYEKLIAGKYILKTNVRDMSAVDIIRSYKGLCRIEEAFKDMKSFFEVRPVFHRCEDNIRGHIFIAVLAYLLEKVLEYYFNFEGKNRITAKRLMEHLSELKLVVNEVDEHRFGTLTEATQEVKAIIKKLGIKKLPETYYLTDKKIKLPKKAIEKLAKYDICSR